jgi:hypothetical protein
VSDPPATIRDMFTRPDFASPASAEPTWAGQGPVRRALARTNAAGPDSVSLRFVAPDCAGPAAIGVNRLALGPVRRALARVHSGRLNVAGRAVLDWVSLTPVTTHAEAVQFVVAQRSTCRSRAVSHSEHLLSSLPAVL